MQNIDIDKGIFQKNTIDIDSEREILENININKEILENVDNLKILN